MKGLRKLRKPELFELCKEAIKTLQTVMARANAAGLHAFVTSISFDPDTIMADQLHPLQEEAINELLSGTNVEIKRENAGWVILEKGHPPSKNYVSAKAALRAYINQRQN